MNYQDRLRAQLVKYKFRALEVLDGPRPHVLPEDKVRLNILPALRERFWAEFDHAAAREGSTLALAADFASVGSAQALVFNLFYPLVFDRSWAESFVETFLGVLGAGAAAVPVPAAARASELRRLFAETPVDALIDRPDHQGRALAPMHLAADWAMVFGVRNGEITSFRVVEDTARVAAAFRYSSPSARQPGCARAT